MHRHGEAAEIILAAQKLKQGHHKKVLGALYETAHDNVYVGFARLMDITGFDRALVRRTVRLLARRGLAEYSNGLFHDDGTVAGSGYAITIRGIDVWEILEEGPNNARD